MVWKLAQWPQVMEAYSTTVIGASALPMTRSDRGPGFISSSTETSAGPAFLRCASAGCVSPQAASDREGGDAGRHLQRLAPIELSACPRGWNGRSVTGLVPRLA